MIFPEIIDALEEPTRSAIKQALSSIAIAGIIPQQIALNKLNVLAGADNELVEELAKKILGMRISLSLLSQFQDVCDSYRKELERHA